MNVRTRLAVFLAVLLSALVVERATSVALRLRGPRAEIARVQPTRLSSATRQRLETLDADVVLTYFASDPERAPAAYRALRDEVCELFETMQGAAKGRLRWEIADPDASPELAAYAALARAQPQRVRTVARDTWTERRVWSSIAIAYGARPRTTIAGVTPEARGVLQNWIVAQLDQLETPERARIALVAPQVGFDELERQLARDADIERFPWGSIGTAEIAADALIWVDPREPGEDGARFLLDWLDSGRSALVAGSTWRLGADSSNSSPRFEPTGMHAPGFLRLLGLDALPGPVLDLRAEQVGAAGDKLSLPWRVACIAPSQDFRGLVGQPNGTLVFASATAFVPERERLDELRFEFDSLASAGPEAWVQVPGDSPLTLEDLRPEAGAPTPRATLAARLTPRDARRGDLIVLGSSSPLSDEGLLRDDLAHALLADVLAAHTTRPERLVAGRMAAPRPQLVPDLSSARRSLWRFLCVALPPLVFAGLALVRRRRLHSGPRARGPLAIALRPFALALAALLALGFAVEFADARLAPRADLTRAGLHRVAPQTRALAARIEEPLELELIFSQDVPGALAQVPARLSDLARGLSGDLGSGLRLRRLRPEGASPEQLEEWARLGIAPLAITEQGADATRGRRVFASARLFTATHSEVLDFPDAASAESLELRLALALGRLAGDPRARGRVVFIADTPRLSPAEAHVEFQTRGLFAPTGADVYALAQRTLERAGFEVVTRAPDSSAPIEDADLVVWLQPRRSIETTLMALASYLARGGRALVAAQHFNVRSRQLADQGFRTVHWPEPQFPDLDQYYLPALGVRLVREVLCDSGAAALELPTEVQRIGTGRDFVLQESTLPVQMRALASRFASDQPLMQGLDDQLFLWGSRIELDPQRLEAAGLRATPLIETGASAWAIDWEGGNLDPDDLAGTGPGARALERAALAVLVEGSFPDAQGERVKDGSLVLLGCSESFKNPHIARADFRADRLLLNLAAGLALGEDYGAIATRRAVAQGFEPPSPERRLELRLWCVAAYPGFLLLFALVWRRVRVRARAVLGRGVRL